MYSVRKTEVILFFFVEEIGNSGNGDVWKVCGK